jgi:hypothetical protein
MKRNFLNYLLLLTLPFLILTTLTACTQAKTLAVGDTFGLGPITVKVIKINEATASQINWTMCKHDMKFVTVELDILEYTHFGDFSTNPVFIEFSSGTQYSQPQVYIKEYYETKNGTQTGIWLCGEGIENGVYSASAWHPYEGELGSGDLNLLFQVNQNESLTALIKLGYQETTS